MLIGLTIIAFGTSASEFVVSIQSLANGSSDMLLGIPVALFGSITPSGFNYLNLFGSSMLLFILTETKRIITRIEGILMLLVFTSYYIIVFVI